MIMSRVTSTVPSPGAGGNVCVYSKRNKSYSKLQNALMEFLFE